MSGREASAEFAAAIAGVVTPREAWRLHQAGAAIIIDVRSLPEWELVGHVPDSIRVEWRSYGASHPNPHFVAELDALFEKDDTLLFLCRSAVRSLHAAEAAAAAGFRHAYNIVEGFEGELDSRQQRGSLGGWRKAGLPWVQG